jgi:hypothetical protein
MVAPVSPADRRRADRHQVLGALTLRRYDPQGYYDAVTMFLRNVSATGLCGIYAAERSISGRDELVLELPTGDLRPLEVVWQEETPDALYHVGCRMRRTQEAAAS